jgi:hypothetical protein
MWFIQASVEHLYRPGIRQQEGLDMTEFIHVFDSGLAKDIFIVGFIICAVLFWLWDFVAALDRSQRASDRARRSDGNDGAGSRSHW